VGVRPRTDRQTNRYTDARDHNTFALSTTHAKCKQQSFTDLQISAIVVRRSRTILADAFLAQHFVHSRSVLRKHNGDLHTKNSCQNVRCSRKSRTLKKHFLITVQTSVDLDNILRAQNGISINDTKFHGNLLSRFGDFLFSPNFVVRYWCSPLKTNCCQKTDFYLKYSQTRMWANVQRDGRPAEYRSRPLFNAAVWLTPTTRVPCSNVAKTQNPLKFAGVPQTRQHISTVSKSKFTILSGHVEEVLPFNKFFSDCRYIR